MDTLLQILGSLGIDMTLFYQLGLFILAYLVLSQLLFKPYFMAYKERQSRTEGNEDHADRIIAETAELETVYQKKARLMNTQHKEIYDRSRSEALHEHDRMVAEARSRAKDIIDSTRSKVNEQLEAARADIDLEARHLSKTIVNQLAGKELIQ